MSRQLCVLCLHVFDNGDTTAKYTRTIEIATLYKLLAPNSKYGHPSEFEGNEICEFCDDCYPIFSTMEDIKAQISLLENEIGSKVKQIQATILDASSQLQNNGDDEEGKIIQIRNMILRVTS